MTAEGRKRLALLAAAARLSAQAAVWKTQQAAQARLKLPRALPMAGRLAAAAMLPVAACRQHFVLTMQERLAFARLGPSWQPAQEWAR